ncbi:MAG: antibiotic biosynthesis monooxygenase family protein [Wenzhouxiangellaceae bacterium]
MSRDRRASRFAALPEPPYYAVIFSSRRTDLDPEGYADTARRMERLAAEQPGFLGMESARDPDGFGITVSYWRSTEAIAEWKRDLDHRDARKRGRSRWYDHFEVRVSKVERAYGHSPADR